MKHINSITAPQGPVKADSLLVTQQKAAIAGTLATATGALATAFNTFQTGLHTKSTNPH
ncbi:MAG: hypothetical protein HZB26_24855 [Candidatus Hydrogenedentes bacterium]|nr:hypothetical protein [Candidatus Hydrogenedentota bacterium]